MKTKRIVIAEDITLLREGLCMMIDAEETLEVVAGSRGWAGCS